MAVQSTRRERSGSSLTAQLNRTLNLESPAGAGLPTTVMTNEAGWLAALSCARSIAVTLTRVIARSQFLGG